MTPSLSHRHATTRRNHATSSTPDFSLETVLGQLSATTGLYSRATFLNLMNCFVRLVRDYRLKGLFITLTQGQREFELATLGLEPVQDVRHIALEDTVLCPATPSALSSASLSSHSPSRPLVSPGQGLVIVLTDQLSAFLHWNTDTEDVFRMLQGGWSFHPADTRTLALQLAQWQVCPQLEEHIQKAPLDRRYDEKLSMLVSSLITNLESRNRELALVLRRESDLHEKVVASERLAAIGQLCAVIAHEIRNPLGLIDLYATLVEGQLQQNGLANDSLCGHIAQIRTATQHLETVLSELTQYSRPLELHPEPLDLSAFVLSVCEFYRPSFEQKGVGLIIQPQLPPHTPETLSADPTRLRQALLNLLKNALEATESGRSVTVTITHRQEDPNLFIRVEDQGRGIAPDFQARLFTPYFSTKGNEGTGLGLAHVRKVMQAHGGNAQLLWSRPGEGSCFALVLPVPE